MDEKSLTPVLIRRLAREEEALRNSSSEFFSISSNEKDLLTWNGLLFGPEGTCYEGGVFKIKLEFPAEYPIKPPKCTFLTQIYHPNIFSDGNICLNILKEKDWRPTYEVETVLIAIHSLLTEPNFMHKVIDKNGKEIYHEVTELGKINREEFNRRAREWVRKYAQLSFE